MHQVCSPSPTPVLGPRAMAQGSETAAPTLPHCQLEARRPSFLAVFLVWEDGDRAHARPGRASSFTGQSSPTHRWPPDGSFFKRRHDVSEFQASRDETKSSTTARQEMQGGLWSTHLLPGCVDTHTLQVCMCGQQGHAHTDMYPHTNACVHIHRVHMYMHTRSWFPCCTEESTGCWSGGPGGPGCLFWGKVAPRRSKVAPVTS